MSFKVRVQMSLNFFKAKVKIHLHAFKCQSSNNYKYLLAPELKYLYFFHYQSSDVFKCL